jgi:hypothetical protein
LTKQSRLPLSAIDTRRGFGAKNETETPDQDERPKIRRKKKPGATAGPFCRNRL